MMKKEVYLLLLIFLIVFLSIPASAKVRKVSIEEAQKIETITLDETINYDGPPAVPYSGNDILESPGIIVGTTNYDQQTNGSSGNRIAIHDCGKHMCWMNGVDVWQGNRWIYYNYVDPDGNVEWEDGVPVSVMQGGGYTQLDVDSEGSALVVYHNSNNLGITAGIDTLCGFGSFTLSDVPHTFPDQHQFFWPYITNDANDRIHVICTENEPAAGDPQVVGHTYSTDGGETWSDLTVYDEIMDISSIITASRVDEKVAIVYTKPIDMEEPSQYNNDAVYIESEDGITWDYEDIINITNYQWEDTIRAYTDIDAVYDYNGNLHIIWNSPGYFADDGTITVDACFLWHWSEATGISMIYDAWHPSFAGSWNRSACKMSIAIDEDNNLFFQWSHFNDTDVSAGGWSNAEIYVSTSIDGGENWIEPINLSDTPCPGCSTGECFSEHWPSMAEFADDSIYILYIEDKDPGRISGNEGAETVNPVRYLAVPTESLLPTSVEDDNSIPDDFELSQNYPNPFNSSTTISYTLSSPTDVKLEIYNLIGQKVETLVNDKVKAGKHSVKWDASKYASGVYFYKLETDDYTNSKKMHLLK